MFLYTLKNFKPSELYRVLAFVTISLGKTVLRAKSAFGSRGQDRPFELGAFHTKHGFYLFILTCHSNRMADLITGVCGNARR